MISQFRSFQASAVDSEVVVALSISSVVVAVESEGRQRGREASDQDAAHAQYAGHHLIAERDVPLSLPPAAMTTADTHWDWCRWIALNFVRYIQ